MLRRVIGILLTLLLTAAIVGFVARRYLTSKGVADKVVAQLQTVYKGEIKLGGVDVGLGSTSLTKLQLFEAGSNEKTPWLEIEDLHTDFSLLDYFQGNSLPGKVKISGAKVLVRFSKTGGLLTTLPEPLVLPKWDDDDEANRFDAVPTIDFEKSEITIRAEGAPDLVFRNISGTLDKNTNQITLSATAQNGIWGKWMIAGLLHKQSANISLQFQSLGAIHITHAMLESLPFVPDTCWQEVRINQMDTPILVHVDYNLKQEEGHCRAELDLAKANFCINALQMAVANAHGKMIFDDNQMYLRALQGDAFDGSIRLGADVIFHSDSIRIDSRIDINQCQVSQLPSSWGLPEQLSGRLNGVASLKVEITPSELSAPTATGLTALPCEAFGPVEFTAAIMAIPFEKIVQTEGSGRGQIIDAMAGQLRVNTIQLELHAVPGGFRFGNGQK